MMGKEFLIMGKRKVFNCIYCAGPVTGRHHAIVRDVYREWQHRKCQTGLFQISFSSDYLCLISYSRLYRFTHDVKAGLSLRWTHTGILLSY